MAAAMKGAAWMFLSLASCHSPGAPLPDGPAGADAPAGCPLGAPSRGGLHWPMPNPPGLDLPNAAHYDTSVPGMVRDDVTGLAWQRLVDGRFTEPEAERYCRGLTLAGGAWRLPTLVELISLVDDTKANPSIDAVAFPGTPGAYFWTSTPRAGAPGMGWGVYFGLGDAYYYDLTDTNAARCVRTSPAAADGCLVARSDTIYDEATGLTWQRGQSGEAATDRTWSDAVADCLSLTVAGGGWRLPRLNELRSLVDYTRAGPSSEDAAAFPDAPGENFWTASEFARTPGSAWYVYFQDGFAGYNTASSTYRVRCVR